MIPPADSDMSTHRTRTNRKDSTMAQEATTAPLAGDYDVIEPPAPPMPAAAHVRLQGIVR